MGIDIGHMLFGGTTNVGKDLAEAGYKKYDPNAAAYGGINPNLGVASTENDPFKAQQMAALQRMNAQATGQGFSAAQSQLQQGTDQAIRAQASMAAANNPRSGGAAAYQSAMGAGGAIQAAGANAAQLRAQEAQAGMQGAAGLANVGAGQNLQLQQGNVANQMQGSEFNSMAQQKLDAMRAAQASQENQAISGGVTSEENSTGMLGGAINSFVGGMGGNIAGVAGMLGGGKKAAATGAVVTKPTNLVAGEAGPEAILPLPKRFFTDNDSDSRETVGGKGAESHLGGVLQALAYFAEKEGAQDEVMSALQSRWGKAGKKVGNASARQ